MQTTLFLVLMGFGLSFAYSTCNYQEVITDQESCCSYYVCHNGRPVRYACGVGTFFSPDVQKCHSQWNVKCGTRSTEGCGSYNNDQYHNNGGSNNDYDNNDQYSGNNDQYYNNGCDNNEDNNLGTNKNIYYWSWTEEGTMFNPLQTDCGPGYFTSDLKKVTKPTIDDAYQKDNYYNYQDTTVLL